MSEKVRVMFEVPSDLMTSKLRTPVEIPEDDYVRIRMAEHNGDKEEMAYYVMKHFLKRAPLCREPTCQCLRLSVILFILCSWIRL